MKKVAIVILCLLGVATIGALLYFKGRRYEVVITQDQIDSALAQRFPVSKRYLLLIGITYSEPVVTLVPDSNRIRIGLKAELDFKRGDQDENVGGTVLMVTGIRYEPDTHQFFLQDPQIEEVQVQGVPHELAERVTSGFLAVGKEALESVPIYTLKADEVKKSVVRLLLQDFQVRNGATHVVLGI